MMGQNIMMRRLMMVCLIALGLGLPAVKAAESDIAKLPTFVLAGGAGVLAPPSIVIGVNNASPQLLRNVPASPYDIDLSIWTGLDFQLNFTYDPPQGYSQIDYEMAPVDGYISGMLDTLIPPDYSSNYPINDYFNGGNLYKDLNGSQYNHPLAQTLPYSGAYSRPFFWNSGFVCPASSSTCVPFTTYNALYIVDPIDYNSYTVPVRIYTYKTNLPPGCVAKALPINLSCMNLQMTETLDITFLNNFANWYSYYSRAIFLAKNNINSILLNAPASSTFFCNIFDFHSIPLYKKRSSTGIFYDVENPCANPGGYHYNGINYAYPYFSEKVITAEERLDLRRYLMLVKFGNENNSTLDSVTYLQKMGWNLWNPTHGYYMARKAPNTDESELNYCRNIYSFMTDPLLRNTMNGGRTGFNGYEYISNEPNPLGIRASTAPHYPNVSEYFAFRMNANPPATALYTAYQKYVVDQVLELNHQDMVTNANAPNVIPNNFPPNTDYWATGIDPAYWQHVNTWAMSTSQDYKIQTINPIINTAGRNGGGSGEASSLLSRVNAELNLPLVAPAGGANGQSSGVALSGQILSDNGVQYRAFYKAQGWGGRVEAHVLGSSGGMGTKLWSTEDPNQIPAHGSRIIKTIKLGSPNTVVDFTWANLSTAQRTALVHSDITALVGAGNSSNAGPWLMDYLRGSNAKEIGQTGGVFRARTSKMGDILSATPVLIQGKDMGYSRMRAPEASSYATFVAAERAKGKLIAVGANDGMLHILNSDGQEIFAFVPSALMSKLHKLALPTYGHEYYVDGGLIHQHAYLGGAWKSILVGSTGAGAKSVFAIDVTNRTSPSILFELTSAQQAQLGFQFGIPRVARIATNATGTTGKWVMIHGNGFESNNVNSNAYARLIITDLPSSFTATPTTQAITTNNTGSNGMAPPAIWTQDHNVEVMYAGDRQGKLWKFNVSTTGVVTVETTPFFNAAGPTGVVQPITTKPEVSLHPQGGLMVYVGTGSIYREDDKTDKKIQSMYAIWDHPNYYTDTTNTRTRAKLLQQTITATSSDESLRVTSDNTFVYGTHHGWYLDLKITNVPDTGERVIASPSVIFGRLLASTYLPIPGGGSLCSTLTEKSWVMSLDAYTGKRPSTNIFDTNGDGSTTSLDALGGIPVSGVKVEATSGPLSVGLTYQNQTLSTTASPGQSYLATNGACNSSSHKLVMRGLTAVCVPNDACEKGFMWVKTGQNLSDNPTSVCINANQRSPRLSWKQLQ